MSEEEFAEAEAAAELAEAELAEAELAEAEAEAAEFAEAEAAEFAAAATTETDSSKPSSPTAKRPMRSALSQAVENSQKSAQAGLIKVDGVYGSKTEEATKRLINSIKVTVQQFEEYTKTTGTPLQVAGTVSSTESEATRTAEDALPPELVDLQKNTKTATEFAKWPSQNEAEPFYDAAADEYYVVVRTEHSNLIGKTTADFEVVITEAKKAGLTKILEYYNKQTGPASYLLETSSEEQAKLESTVVNYGNLDSQQKDTKNKISQIIAGGEA
mgnify:FL=1|tara:strand:- start:298 stop:1113 length:816 start_codon:yes stop_codon:yes gene_type:complete